MIPIIIAGLCTYLAVSAWVFGYAGGLDGQGETQCYRYGPRVDQPMGLFYYRDEACAWLPAIFWPLTGIHFVLKLLAQRGYNHGVRAGKRQRVRVALQEKQRVELAAAEQDLEDELHSASIQRR